MSVLVMEKEPLIVEGLSKSYGESKVLNEISLTLNQGEIFGVLGRNGVGKTTFLESLIGLRSFEAKRVEILGLDANDHRKFLTNKIGVQPQEAALMQRQKVREIMELFASFYEEKTDINGILDDYDMQGISNKYVKDLSVGQRQRLLIALALVGNPSILILDEPTAGLDPQVRLLIWDNLEKLKKQGKTILITTHYMEEASQLCDRIAILHDGRFVVCDTPKKVIQKHATPIKQTLESAFINLTGSDLRRGVD
ncbi:ABC transporter ATP-binding protein [Mesobacillus subterraneus]|uniref:ABC transporter ATP-binding protein n=1 Tax=Mesobacillus subterraneus TaxID=285983 RepID=UPI001CFCD64D|nr:ABC transporter ATP-binding protein [Mesobacillus subterraneus]WLR54581.1 ABC transporter ATP-binding protein [Mesobacillus subterraneus]